ncbi:MAG: energy-coupling factor transporter transmembrane protein EcfT, partial [Spirochaetaceae bacterium]|jgi:cobalt/nickel transport system permease protein|nr:energy-coupling factor transporter transmembrane protein EcfT [Spirochaetaceae bacterium]
LLKTALSVCAVLILIATTPFTALAECLTAPRFFRPLGLQLALSYRYIAALLSEAEAMWTAYSLRSPGSRAVAIADFGSFLGQLLLRSFDRAQRIYDAMRCRGFSGVYYGPERPRKLRESVVFVACASIVLIELRFFPLNMLIGRFL